MIAEILEYVVFNSLGQLFPILQKKIYSSKDLEKDIEIDVRSTSPISFQLSNIPVAIIYFKITNKSQYLNLVLDRLSFDLWIKSEHQNQPFLNKASFVEKEEIKQKDSKDIFCKIELKNSQIQKLKEIKEEKKLPSTSIYLNAYFNTSLYEIKKVVRLENKSCEIEGR